MIKELRVTPDEFRDLVKTYGIFQLDPSYRLKIVEDQKDSNFKELTDK